MIEGTYELPVFASTAKWLFHYGWDEGQTGSPYYCPIEKAEPPIAGHVAWYRVEFDRGDGSPPIDMDDALGELTLDMGNVYEGIERQEKERRAV